MCEIHTCTSEVTKKLLGAIIDDLSQLLCPFHFESQELCIIGKVSVKTIIIMGSYIMSLPPADVLIPAPWSEQN